MSASALVERLVSARQCGPARWRARCPAHDGHSGNTLSIAETSDGTVLVKCFAGCTALEIVAAVGLDLTDLFPRVEWQATGSHHAPPRRVRPDWPAVIAACERDLILIKIVLNDLAEGQPVNDADAVACQAAATRVIALLHEARHG
jgi:hypothetical protein